MTIHALLMTRFAAFHMPDSGQHFISVEESTSLQLYVSMKTCSSNIFYCLIVIAKGAGSQDFLQIRIL